ncbi:uncharacterized protein F4812DRAFT_441200 [Daldinia caldariorum]|uniref:uncharacterized protein n=1 Tax=Daldinia caldariorum TaxID=326644 RepID=UPI002007AEF6|nr:uncharacterized protein F4812DRAFT_441200 [Daldinia caldariorum]KAI1464984.1 hypothetical protein F4812DRAFT_441200 [Daldinia caldariorum]
MAQDKMTLEDWLDDLCVRFIINLPREDLSSVARICFQIEEAQWFYEDFIRPLDPTLPSMSLRSFSLKMFQHCPLLASFSADVHIKAFEEFMQYKTRVPVRGAVMLNDNMDAAVLVRGYKKGASWSFPRGKINKDEDDLDCAIREVYEETGYDLREAGLVEKNEPVHPLEVTMHDQQVRLYVFRGIPEDTIFETRTRKEIGGIKWYKVEELPAYRKKKGAGKNGVGGPSNEKFYMVAPFMVQLRQWVMKQKKLDAQKFGHPNAHNHPQLYEENFTDDNIAHQPVQVPPTAGSNLEYIDSATKELHRLLKVKPPTQGLQILSPTSDQQAGQALLSLLRPKASNDEEASRQAQGGNTRIPFDPSSSKAPEPVAPPHHHHHHEQHIPVSSFAGVRHVPANLNLHYGTSRLASEANPNPSYAQHRARPHVNITTELPGPPSSLEQPRQPQKEPVQLVHPQPLPPQVQKAMLLRGMASSPQVTDNTAGRPGLPRAPQGNQGNQYGTYGPQAHNYGPQGLYPEGIPPTELPAHPANLLNVLKGGTAQPDVNQGLVPELPGQAANMPMAPNPQHHFPAPGNAFASQYEATAMLSSLNNLSINNGHAISSGPSSGPGARPNLPTDKHRTDLLNMFKKTESLASQNEVDREMVAQRSSRLSEGERQQWPSQSHSTAGSVRSAAHENNRPVQMNPEANLPFRALTILSRPQPGQQSPTQNRVASATGSETGRYPATTSQLSHRSFNRASPPYTNSSPRPYQLVPQKTQQLGRSSPRTYADSTHSYPYGTSQGSQHNALSLLQGPPSASALPVPGSIQFRQDSTAEQKSTLLSLFGKSPSNFEQTKGKEPASVDQFGASAAPRSRLGSVASSGGDGRSGLRGSVSTRESQAPLSSADRNFLLNFLENASNSASR